MESSEALLIGLSTIFLLGTVAQWLAWKLHLPSILLLLAFGYLAGPGMRAIQPDWPHLDPDGLLGELLFPVVAAAVGVILFEGALGLRLEQLREIGRPLLMLLSVGIVISGVLSALAARYVLALEWSTSVLLGALLVVTGPTVIGPLLRQIRPVGQVGPIARWEGIVIDPIGAILAVLVFEGILAVRATDAGNAAAPALHTLEVLLQTMFIGTIVGVIGAVILAVLLRRHLVPDYLQSPVALMFVLVGLTVSNTLREESGLLAVTVMGIVVANVPGVVLKHILEFKESLSVVLISSLFIVLTARLDPSAVAELGWRGAAYVACLILVVRPAAVFAATWGSRLQMRERVFLACLAPRGIVAAAVASLFALRLTQAGVEAAQRGLVAATFVVIAATVIVYGLAAAPLARRLGLATPNPQGVLIAGANDFARAVAVALKQLGLPVRVVDMNHQMIKRARMEGVPATTANIVSERAADQMDLGGIGRFLGMTANDEVNALASLHFAELFGRSSVYQLTPERRAAKGETTAGHLRGRFLFGEDATYSTLARRLAAGAVVKATKLTEEFDYSDFQRRYRHSARLLFTYDGRQLTVVTGEWNSTPKPGQTLVALVDAAAAEEAKQEPP